MADSSKNVKTFFRKSVLSKGNSAIEKLGGIDAVRRRIESGESWIMLAAEAGVSKSSLYESSRHAAGFKAVRGWGAKSNDSRRKGSVAVTKEEILQLWRDGLSYSDISGRLKVYAIRVIQVLCHSTDEERGGRPFGGVKATETNPQQ